MKILFVSFSIYKYRTPSDESARRRRRLLDRGRHLALSWCTGLCDVSVTGAWGRIDDSVTAGGLGRGARCMQPSIAAENTRRSYDLTALYKCIIIIYYYYY